jgi:uncharacterized protein
MSIKEKLDADLKAAMKEKDSRRVGCVRMLKSKLLEREVALRTKHGKDYSISDEEAQGAIVAYAKQRRDSIESYRGGGREDLATAEEAELEIVRSYLPKQLSADELRALVREAISESGATTVRDLGAVMKIVVPRTQGVADGKEISGIVREMLSGRSGC